MSCSSEKEANPIGIATEGVLLRGGESDPDMDQNSTSIEIDNDFALLEIAKHRILEQKALADSRTKLPDEEDETIESANDDEVDGYDDDEEEGEEEIGAELQPSEQKKVVSFEEKKDDAASGSGRKQSDENAEIWDLLRQSKCRIQSTRNVIVEESEFDESQRSAQIGLNYDDATDEGVLFSDRVVKTNEQLREEERKRKFQNENRELWKLLQKSKNRLEEAAKAKMKEASKAAAANEKVPAPVARAENPYRDIDTVPDDADSDDALTQKELLLAMAVAEEASRSGKECFATPSREELRTRDIRSFDFLKSEFGQIPETPIGNDAKEEERERNRFDMLSQALSSQWTSFRAAVGDLDISQRLPRLGQQSKV